MSRRRRSWRGGAVLVAAAALATVGLAGCQPERAPARLSVSTVLSGIDRPWDIAFTRLGSMLFTERPGPIRLRRSNGEVRTLAVPGDVVAAGEGGMMGIAVDPNFNANNRIYTCFMSNASGRLDVRVVRWRASDAGDRLEQRRDIVTGIPVSTGRHSGCRIRFGPDANLWVGTGDAAIGSVPQDRNSLGGKVLRVDTDGNGVPGNLGAPYDHRIQSYGHRNVQGIAFSPSSGRPYAVEHGPERDDEVNYLIDGANYGWDPRPAGGGSGYDESVPMTDTNKYPNAVRAVWSSGYPTIAPSGATFLSGTQWAGWNQGLAMAVLKGQQLRVLSFDGSGRNVDNEWVRIPDQGRLRTAVQGPNGDLYLAQDASPGKILRVHPSN